MNKNFLLGSRLSRRIYREIKDLPIIDYHNHIAIDDIAENRKYNTITELWITPDPYKHRAMRILGVPEKYITGDGTDIEKFEAFCKCLPLLQLNPLYDWAKMELKTVFGIDLNPEKIDTDRLYRQLNEALSEMRAQDILAKFNIEYSAPCASLCDSADRFSALSAFAPSLRLDEVPAPTKTLIEKLSSLTKTDITDIDTYLSAVEKRCCAFIEVGAKFADHALDDGFNYIPDDGKCNERFLNSVSGNQLSTADRDALYSYILVRLISMYERLGITVQLHIGAKRRTSERLLKIAGPAGGFAAIGNSLSVSSLTALLGDAEKLGGKLPKTVLFSLNPQDNALLANLSGSYSKDGVTATVTQGPAWWWCDHYKGIYEMLDSFSAHSVLSTFIGMTTDSRSLLSFVRHDYFRRILSNFLAERIKSERMTDNLPCVIKIARMLSYENAKKQVSI